MDVFTSDVKIDLKRDLGQAHLDNTYAEDYYWYLNSHEFGMVLGLLAAQIIKDSAVNSVLDVGCGEGQLSAFFIEENYVGLEGSQVALETAQRLYGSSKQRQWIQGRLESTRVKADFDCVVMGGVLHCLVEQHSWIDLIADYVRCYGVRRLGVYDLKRADFSLLDKAYDLLYQKDYTVPSIGRFARLPRAKLQRQVRYYSLEG